MKLTQNITMLVSNILPRFNYKHLISGIFFILIVVFPSISFGSNEPENHKHGKNEIGISNSTVYFVNEKTIAYGIHLHYLKNIPDTKFGIGLGFEKIFDEHNHNIASIMVVYKPIEQLNLSLSPGLAFEEKLTELSPAIHFESLYEFEFKHFHIGPVFSVAHDTKDLHFSLGVHLSFGF